MTLMRFSPEFDPVDALLALQRELSSTLDRPFGLDLGPSGRGVYPAINVFTDREGYVLRMEVPGVAPEDLEIETQSRTLRVFGKRDIKPPGEGSFHRRERAVGEFSRSLQLPADLDTARAEASCKHGMLTIRIPKSEEAKPHQISVKAA
jgi:HSP20 family protein